MKKTITPYTTEIPASNTLGNVVFTEPQNVQIAWPDITGGTVKKPQPTTLTTSLFG